MSSPAGHPDQASSAAPDPDRAAPSPTPSSGPPTSGPLSAGPDSAVRRENHLLRELVGVYSHLSGLASQDADMAGVVRLVAHRTQAAVLVLGPGMEPLVVAPADAPARLGAAIGAAELARVLSAA